jgi:hypothetical protein
MENRFIQGHSRFTAKGVLALGHVAEREMRFLVGHSDWMQMGVRYGIVISDVLYTYNTDIHSIYVVEEIPPHATQITFKDIPNDIMMGFAFSIILDRDIIPGTKLVKTVGPFPYSANLAPHMNEIMGAIPYTTTVDRDDHTFMIQLNDEVMEYEIDILKQALLACIEDAETLAGKIAPKGTWINFEVK